MSGTNITLDRRSFDQAIQRFSKESGLAAGDVLKDQMRLFVEKAVGTLPPKSAAQGKAAIKKDVCSVLGAIDDQKALRKLNEMFENRFSPLRFETGGEAPARIEAAKYRTKRGRIKYKADTVHIPKTQLRFSGKMHVSKRVRNAIIREKSAKVGTLKSGFMKAVMMLNSRVPAWVSKGNGPGEAVNTLNGGNGYIEVANKVPYSERHQPAMEKILQGRVRAIGTRIEKELIRLAKKASATGG
jgi:hypothetical protein